MGYNDNILSLMWNYVDTVMRKISARDKQGRTIRLLKQSVAFDDESNRNKYINSGTTYGFDVEYFYEVSGKTEEGTPFKDKDSFSLTIPRMLHNTFVIEGKERVATSTLVPSGECIVRLMDNGNGRFVQYDLDRKVMWYQKTRRQEERMELRIKSDIDGDILVEASPTNFEAYKDYLYLNEDLRDKLRVKLDTDDVPEYITYDLTMEMMKRADNNKDKYEDLIIDKEFSSTEKGLMDVLSYATLKGRSIIVNLQKNFFKQGKIYPTELQSAIIRYFKVADSSSIDIPRTINPVVFDSLSSKVIFAHPHGSPTYMSYNRSMSDIIDPVNTPNNNNIGTINALTKCAEVKEDGIYIKCYEFPSFKPVTVKYLRYVNSMVLMNTEADYDAKKVERKAAYRVKLRFKELEIPLSQIKGVKYIEPFRDDKLSVGVRMIPMLNVSDSVRNFMGTGMVQQAEELFNAEPPLVATGHEDDTDDYSIFTVRYEPKSGKPAEVLKVDEANNVVEVRDADGSEYPISLPRTHFGEHDLIITHQVMVKEGQKIKPGDIICTPTISKDKGYNLGVNANVAYMPYLGKNYEDAVIISESFAKRAACYKVVPVEIKIRRGDLVRFLKPIGAEVKLGEILCGRDVKINDAAGVDKEGFPLMDFMNVSWDSRPVYVPNNIEKGWVIDCKIMKNPDVKSLIRETDQYISDYVANGGYEVENDAPERYKNIKVHDVEMDEKSSYTIMYHLLKYAPLMNGIKLTNRWGGKGEVGTILPDDQMPYDMATKKPFDCILNPSSIIKRKNPPQVYEALITKICDAVYAKCLTFVEKGDVAGARRFSKAYYGKQFDGFTDAQFKKGVLEKGRTFFSMKVGCYFKYDSQTVIKWAKSLGVSAFSKVFIPGVGPVDKPVLTGPVYMMRLYHASDYEGKVTSDLVDAKEPHMGRGLYRGKSELTGQKMGEMDQWALRASGTGDYVNKHRVNFLDSQYIFLNELLMAGMYVNDAEGRPLLSPQWEAAKRK
jgi:DNA-directed RNA polymerase beta subunit